MKDKKNWLSLVGICIFLFFVIIFGSLDTLPPMPTTEPPKVLPDLGMTFEEFQSKYNETAMSNSLPQYVLREENIRKYGIYNLCQYSYSVLKVGIDEKTKNISYIEVYGEYTGEMTEDEKRVLFVQQKQIFEIASEVIEIEDAKYKEKVNSILDSSLEYWNGDAVTLKISSKIPHVSEYAESLPISTSDISYLAEGCWCYYNGGLHEIYRKTKIKWTGRSIILSNGSKAYQFEFLEGAYTGEFGFWSSSFQ